MDLHEKILSLYSTLNISFFGMVEYVILQDDGVSPPSDKVSVGNTYIAYWNHPTLSEPTQAQIDAVTTNPTTEQLTWDYDWTV